MHHRELNQLHNSYHSSQSGAVIQGGHIDGNVKKCVAYFASRHALEFGVRVLSLVLVPMKDFSSPGRMDIQTCEVIKKISVGIARAPPSVPAIPKDNHF